MKSRTLKHIEFFYTWFEEDSLSNSGTVQLKRLRKCQITKTKFLKHIKINLISRIRPFLEMLIVNMYHQCDRELLN